MVTRLSASDASFYQLENTATPMYVGLLLILRRPRAGLSYEALLETVEQRLPQIPRYRQKVQEVKLGLAGRCGSTIATSTSPTTSGGRPCRRRVVTSNCTS